jgi:hypothetical protein
MSARCERCGYVHPEPLLPGNRAGDTLRTPTPPAVAPLPVGERLRLHNLLRDWATWARLPSAKDLPGLEARTRAELGP